MTKPPVPSDAQVAREMAATGLDPMQATRRIQQRWVIERYGERRRVAR